MTHAVVIAVDSPRSHRRPLLALAVGSVPRCPAQEKR
jgi:hypothetical protein